MENDPLKQTRENLQNIGLSDEYSQIYLHLWSNGPKTVVQLARHFELGRNQIYRILRELQRLHIVNKIDQQKGSVYEAMHYRNLQALVDKKHSQFLKAKTGLNDLFGILPNIKNASNVSSNVLHYYGLEGLKQVNWNLCHADGIYRVYEVSRLSEYLDYEYAEKLRLEWFNKKLHTRDLTNDTEIEEHTNVTEFIQKYSEYRHLDPEFLKINSEIYI